MAIKPTDQEILALYQEAGQSGPGDELDRNILTAARAAVKSDSTPAPWWPRWRLPLQAVATICLFAMVSIMLEHREPMTPAIPPLAMNDSGPATDQQPPPPAVPGPATVVAESRVRMADQAPKQMRSEARMAAPAAPAHSPASSEAVLSSAPAGRSVAAESAVTVPMATPEAVAVPSAKATARIAADQARSPKDWLDSIQTLIKQNRLQEAQKSLDAFVQAYPGEAVPDELRTKLRTTEDGASGR